MVPSSFNFEQRVREGLKHDRNKFRLACKPVCY